VSIFNPVRNWRALKQILALLVRRRELLWEMTRRELTERHAGQILGGFWAIAHPVVIMVVYVFLFGVIFKAKIESSVGSVPLDYTVYILSGLLPWLVFQDAMNRGTDSVVSNAQLVKQVVFPIELLPQRVVLAALIRQVLFFAILAVFVLLRYGALPRTFLLLPILMLLQTLAASGLCFLFSAVGCYIRDLKELVSVFGFINIYLMPVVYLPAWVPELLQPLLAINPFSYMIWCYQDAVFFGHFEHPWAWLVFPVLSMLSFVLGYRAFCAVKTHLSDML